MGRNELRVAGERLLAEARAVRAAYPDGAAMRRVPASGVGPTGDDEGSEALRAAMRYLRDEMAVVRDGRAGTLAVLDDEVANVERRMRDLARASGADEPPP